MRPEHIVHELRHAHVDDDAREGKRVTTVETVLAVPDDSPPPCRPCPSPAEKSAPSTGIGRNSFVPATSSLQSMFPTHTRGGLVAWMPGFAGGIPRMPRNGWTVTSRP